MVDVKPVKFLIFFSKKGSNKVVLRLFVSQTCQTSFTFNMKLIALPAPQNITRGRGTSQATIQARFALLAAVVERLLKNGLVS